MEDLIERILGFLPYRFTIWSALIVSVFIWISQYIFNVLSRIFMLPWQRKENQQKRSAILKEEKS
jgi:hypothetical protein